MNAALNVLFNTSQKQQIETLLNELTPFQISWLAGYLCGISQLPATEINGKEVKHESASVINGHSVLNDITILVGSRTGNGTSIGKKLLEQFESIGISAQLKDMSDYSMSKLKDEKKLLVIVSTHGEGEPPVVAEEFYNFLFGKRAPSLSNTQFSVLALGDKSYVQFCKIGKDVDEQLEKLGAKRLLARVDCDVDFSKSSEEWIQIVLKTFANKIETATSPKINGYSVVPSTELQYNKQNPFPSKLLDRIKLSGRDSEKETYHYELSLQNSGLKYEPGDSLGVYSNNSAILVNQFLDALALLPYEEIQVENAKVNLRDALTKIYEISTLSPDVVAKYNAFAKNSNLENILADTQVLKEYLYGRDVLDLFLEYPVKLTSIEVISLLRKLQPRMYSISSSYLANPDEVHITVATVRYNNGRYKEGVCSSFLADRVGDEDDIKVYIEKNHEFRLPANPDAPIVMIGPGTGIAPFRAFIQEREAKAASGKNWLFFGDRHFTSDFLYQTEWQSYLKKGLITKLNVAFSRDSEKKLYVQHKMLEHSKDLFKWIEDGAHIYVCGDMKNMFRDVNKTLLAIISSAGGMSEEKAQEYIQKLKKERRYQVDVY